MPITYPVDVENTLWSVWDVSAGELIARNKKWPVLDGSEIPGADPNFVYLLQQETAKPDYDPRTHTLVKTETPDPDNNVFTITYATQQRSEEEIVQSIVNEEQAALEGVAQFNRRSKLVLLGLTVLFRKLDGLVLNQKETAIKDELVATGVKLWKNDANMRAKVAALAAGNLPDLSDGWEKEQSSPASTFSPNT